MKFGAPENFIWLWIILPLGLFGIWSFRHRNHLMARFSSLNLIPKIAGEFEPRRVYWRWGFLILAVFFAILALARPQWGYQVENIKRRGTDILLVVDVSKSMLTRDVKPNRLERTKLAIKDLVKKLNGDRVGLIAFAGDAFLTCPLTVDYGGFILGLDELGPDSVSRGGTDFSSALSKALQEYDLDGSKYKAIVILTDGENLAEDPMPLVRQAKDKGIKIFTVGVGTPQGELIQYTNEKGETDFLKDNQGNIVKSRLNENLLQQVALTTGGIYVRASGAQFGLDVIYDREISKFNKQDYQSKSEKKYFERFQFPLAAALIFLVLELVWPTGKKDEDG